MNNENRRTYEIRIDGKLYLIDKSAPTGAELLALAGKSADKFLLTLVIAEGPDRLVDPDETIDLSAPGIEEFNLVTKERFYSFRVDESEFSLPERFQTGRQLLALVGKTPDTHLLTISLEYKDDELIDTDEKVDLAQPGREQFYAVVRNPLTIIIDDVPYHPGKQRMLGSELRGLPKPPVAANRDLWLDVPGKDDLRIQPENSVELKDGMVFYTAPSTINPGEVHP